MDVKVEENKPLKRRARAALLPRQERFTRLTAEVAAAIRLRAACSAILCSEATVLDTIRSIPNIGLTGGPDYRRHRELKQKEAGQ